MNVLKFEDVTKEYKVGKNCIKAADNLNFMIEEGKLTVILGPSGSGKSTTLNLIGGMDRVSSGKIFAFDKDITKYSDKELTNYRREKIGFVFQFYNLIPNLNAYENVDISRKLGKNPLDAKEMIEAVGLEGRMYHFPSEMSGGELQRLSIARALCKGPDIILCDEPTGALDSATGRTVLELLERMVHLNNKTVIIVTHNASIALCADTVIRIKDGKIESITENSKPVPVSEVQW